MVLQIGLQFRMTLHELGVIHERRILMKLLGGFAMTVQEAVEACQFAVCSVATAAVLSSIVAVFRLHESVWIIADLVANFGMSLQVSLQSGMVLQKFAVIEQRRILVNLFADFAVPVEELIETCQFPIIDVAGFAVGVVNTIFGAHELVGILPNLLGNFGMVPQIGLQRGM